MADESKQLTSSAKTVCDRAKYRYTIGTTLKGLIEQTDDVDTRCNAIPIAGYYSSIDTSTQNNEEQYFKGRTMTDKECSVIAIYSVFYGINGYS